MSATVTAECAQTYARHGLPVLPLWWPHTDRCACGRSGCTTPGKHPTILGGAHSATTDPETVTAWWRTWPEANIGIVPPPGVVVIDVDPRNNGATALLSETRKHGPLAPTWTAATGGNGLHGWYRYGGKPRGKPLLGVDVICGPGQFVVAPPSRHVSGTKYAWITGLPIANAPEWLCRLITPELKSTIPKQSRRSTASGYDGLIREIRNAQQGQRNNKLSWVARTILLENHGERAIDEARAAAMDAGLGAHEVDATIRSARRHAQRVG